MWNPGTYLAFADHRGRPFSDLLARIDCESPQRVVDLGCGPGNLTEQLIRRWPGAVVEALDASPQMVAAARRRGVDAHLGDLRSWTPQPGTEVVLSHAALQWVPDHSELLVRWAGALVPGAWIAVQLPGNYDAPSHTSVRHLLQRQPWAQLIRDSPIRADNVVQTPAHYAELLTNAGCRVEAWETTYLHDLFGDQAVLNWITDGDLNPLLTALTDEQAQNFRAELIPPLNRDYPPRPDGRTYYPFRRVFVVAHVR
ncbi:MAG: trans-aconitate 2-methyltransferase [Mycobacterium sp.]